MHHTCWLFFFFLNLNSKSLSPSHGILADGRRLKHGPIVNRQSPEFKATHFSQFKVKSLVRLPGMTAEILNPRLRVYASGNESNSIQRGPSAG